MTTDAPIAVLHADDHVLVVSKPAGVLVHRTALSRRREPFLLQRVSDQVGRYLYPVHRLDRNTSGVLCFALTSEAARDLQAALASDDALKTYLVLARGETPDAFSADRPLRNDRGEPGPARTDFRTLARFDGCSLLEARLHTGRLHQIRRHLNHLGHHVIGDTTHGKGHVNRRFRESVGLPRMFIHARRVSCAHPDGSRRLEASDPLAPDLRAALARMDGADAALIETL